MKSILSAVKKFFGRYTLQAHFMLFLWNTFLISWGTKTAIPLDESGSVSLNASVIMADIQSRLHIKTLYVGIFTFLINMTLFYSNWKKTHPQLAKQQAEELVDKTQKLAAEARSVAATANNLDGDNNAK